MSDDFRQSFDARDWAKAFCERFPQNDEGTMIGWFANALMRGYDEPHHGAKAPDLGPLMSSEHMARCQAMPGGVTESEKAIIGDLRDMEALQEQNIEIVKQALGRAASAEKGHADYVQECNVLHNEDNAKLQAAEALLVEAREALKEAERRLRFMADFFDVDNLTQQSYQRETIAAADKAHVLLARLERKEGGTP